LNAARLLHELGVIIWVGGMFFANFALRPSVAKLEPPPQRLSLLLNVFTRFLLWAGASIVAVIASGVVLVIMLGGMKSVGTSVHLMIALGLVMTVIYCVIVAGPYKRFRNTMSASDVPGAARAMARIRVLVAVNLALGLATVIVAVLGHRA